MPRSHAFRRLATVVVVAALAAGCSSDGGERSGGGLGQLVAPPVVDPGSPGDQVTTAVDLTAAGEWTVFVYLAADNDLEPFALDDLDEMGEATGVDLVVLVDRHGAYSDGSALGLGDFEDTRLLHIRDGVVEVVDEPGELDMGDPDVLADFVADGLDRFASERNGLVIWNHGASWPGAAIDETSGGSLLSLGAIRGAITDGLARTDVDAFDLVGFDACLMATYEVAQNLAPVAHSLLASEELEPGHGWNWEAVSAPGGTISAVDLAQSVVDGFAAQSRAQQTSGVTLSLVDLAGLGNIDLAIEAMADAVEADAGRLVGRIGAQRADALGFGRDPDPTYDVHMVDLGHLAVLLGGIDELSAPAADLEAAIDRAVLVNVTDATTAPARGLAAYFPPTASLGQPSYESVPDIAPWVRFLGSFYTGAQAIPSAELPAFVDDDRYLEDADVGYSASALAISAAVVAGTGVNVVSGKLFWGEVDPSSPDRVAFFGERLATVDGDMISAEYDWRYLVIEDGLTEASAYAQLDVGDDGSIRRIVVPVGYTRLGHDEIRAVLVLGVEGGNVVSETFYGYAEEGTVGELSPGDGDTFVPWLLVQDLDDFSTEWLPSTATPLSADPASLEHHLRRLTPGTPMLVELNLTDVEGGLDHVFHGTISP